MSDLISRQEAVELIERMKPCHQDADDIAEMIDNMPSAQLEASKDAVSRRAVVSRISDLLMLELKGERLPTWNEVYNAVGDLPPIMPSAEPSVPVSRIEHEIEWLRSQGNGFAGIAAANLSAFLERWKEQNEANR